jgi:phage gp29-like protein
VGLFSSWPFPWRKSPEERAALASASGEISFGQNTIRRWNATAVDVDFVDETRELRGGQLSPSSVIRTRWYEADVETALRTADNGDLTLAGELYAASLSDGVFAGTLKTRTEGLVRLPKNFRGNEKLVAELRAGEGSIRSVYDEMCPPTELSLLVRDGICMGFFVGELLPVAGRSFPRLVRHEPEFLRWLPQTNGWAYQTVGGLMPITPGDGRWVLGLVGGTVRPWRNGIWRAAGPQFIRKKHANLYDGNWLSKLANPARIAYSPSSATDAQEQSFFQKLLNWGLNTVLGLPPGYEAKLLESNGKGSEAFQRAIDRADRELIFLVNGQTATSDGGNAFQSNDMFKSVKQDLIKAGADMLAYVINTQIIPPWIVANYGVDALSDPAIVEYDSTSPQERVQEASALQVFGAALDAVNDALARYDLHADPEDLSQKFGVRLRKGARLAVAEDHANDASPPAAANSGNKGTNLRQVA